MSQGITPYDFVQQVYYMQEKTILDFWPTDDKYKEVLMEANLVLQELQNVEDWTWLRERIVLGDTRHVPGEIPEYRLPPWVYKVSTLFGDTLKLYKPDRHWLRHHHHHHHVPFEELPLSTWDYIEVPFASAGYNNHRRRATYNHNMAINYNDMKLYAVVLGDIVTFNRMPFPPEERRVVVCDVQKRIEQFHICNDKCEIDDKGPHPVCKHDQRLYLTEIPDPNYVIMQTAARHAEGSPSASARVLTLQDNAQKILSSMRQNDTSATSPDYIEWEVPGFFEVI
jgi:hypothetical protein